MNDQLDSLERYGPEQMEELHARAEPDFQVDFKSFLVGFLRISSH